MSRPLACADRSGFLFAHACDRPAAGTCGVCHKPICTEHTRMGPQGMTCVTCLRGDDNDDVDSDTDSDDSESNEGRGEDDPYLHGGARAAAYYDADDYRAFDPTPDQPSGLETETTAS
jgi:hypothetical protein